MSSPQHATAALFVFAAGLATPAFAADLEAGRARAASICAACHGADGVSVANHIPHLAGQRAAYLESQLKAFKDARRKHDVMGPIAAQLAPTDIVNLAAYFATLPGAAAGGKSKPLSAFTQTRYTIPADFPKGFVPFKSNPSDGGKSASVNYVNATALAAAKAGIPLPDGSAIVGVSMEVALDAAGKPRTGMDGFPVAAKILSYSAMASGAGWGDAIPDLLRNGNWSYGQFNAEGQARSDLNYAECYACHKPKGATSYVFALDAIKAAKP